MRNRKKWNGNVGLVMERKKMSDELCKRFYECYFPKDVAKGKHDKEGMDRYLNSCNYKGMDCELLKFNEEKNEFNSSLGKKDE